MRHQSIFPHPLFSSFIFIVLLLSGLPFTALSQSKKPSRSEFNTNKIDSIFNAAENNQLNTHGVLRYEFHFSDPDKKKFADFSIRMAKDSFESDELRANGKAWNLSLFKNASYSRESILELERKLRNLKYSFSIDHYLGFSIYPADPDPMSVPDVEFSAYITTLSDEQLYWVGKRLMDMESYDRALPVLKRCVNRKIRTDTSTYRYGQALIATHEPADGINQWKKAVSLNPDYLEVFLALGKIHFENGYFKEALGYYQRADTLQPNDPKILLHIGETLYPLERYNRSYDYAMRSHQLDHKNIYTRSLLKLLNEPRVKYLRKEFPEK